MNEMHDPATLAPTPVIDSDHPAVIAVAQRAAGVDDRERAVALYQAVRDGFRYDPYRVDLSVAGMRASSVLELGIGWCVTKAALLDMLNKHLALTTNEAVARLKQNWTDDVAAFDGIFTQAMMMADALTDGIAKQFPTKVS